MFAGYASRKGYALVDKRLFLPERWWMDAYAARRTKCHVPTERTFQSKPQLAAAMLEAMTHEGLLPFKYIVADCLYGNSPTFLDATQAEVLRKMLRQLKLAANPPPLAPARARHATCDGVAEAYAVARGCVGAVRAATGCRPLLSVCHPVGHRLSQPPCPRPAPQGTAEALPSPMPSRWSRPRYPWLRAAPAGRPQRAGGAARAGARRGRRQGRAAAGTGQKCF